MAGRLEAMGTADYQGLTISTKTGPVWNGTVRTANPKQMLKPLSWKKPTLILVNSMSDLFHEDLPDDVIDQVFAVMSQCPQHTFQCLTKRANRMRDYCSARRPLPHVWLGVSVEDQQRADERIPLLTQTPAAVRFLSCEPLLGQVDVSRWTASLAWVIAGAESGRGARPCDIDWIRHLRDQCGQVGVAFFLKQFADARGHKIPTPELVWGFWCQAGKCCSVPPLRGD